MKFFKTKFFIFLFSIFISIIVLIIFKPILISKTLIFPYAIHPFDIAKTYPRIWFYIKIAYCLNLFVSNFLILKSLSIFFKFNKPYSIDKNLKSNHIEYKSNFNLLIGNNAETQDDMFIPEKGLYQNILVTGTIRFSEKQALSCIHC